MLKVENAFEDLKGLRSKIKTLTGFILQGPHIIVHLTRGDKTCSIKITWSRLSQTWTSFAGPYALFLSMPSSLYYVDRINIDIRGPHRIVIQLIQGHAES